MPTSKKPSPRVPEPERVSNAIAACIDNYMVLNPEVTLGEVIDGLTVAVEVCLGRLREKQR